MKARGTMLMALPDKDQLKFHSYKDAKLLMEAIEKRYGGNKESKKVQKTLLKQQYKNFAGSSSETMDQTFDRLHKLISQLEIQGEVITQEDINLKLLRSLPSKWKTRALIWRNKEEIETISLDDFTNSNSNSITNEADNTTYGVSAAHTQKDLEQIDPDDLEEMDLQWEMAMLTIRARRFIKRTGRKLDVNGQRVGFDRSKVECYNCHKNGHFARECRAPRNQENRGRESLESVEARLAHYKKNEAVFEESINVLNLEVKLRDNALVENKKKLEKAEKERDELKLTLEKFQNSSKSLNNLLESQVSDKFKTGLGYNTASSTAASPAVEIESKNMDVITVVTPSNVKKNSFRPSVIEDWNSDDDSEEEFIPNLEDKTVRPNTEKIEFVKSTRETVKKGNPQQKEYKEKRVFDSGCSRHMTGNKCYLTEYKDYDGGFVSFGDGKGRISRKVLSSDFKLLDESQVLLRVPRKDNIYSVELKSIVPTKGLTCLFAKATIDESNLWHRRLGHINFKNINKLVKGNLGIKREFSVARTPQQNGVAKRKNRTLIEAARTMLVDSNLLTTFWAEAVKTAFYVLNRVLVIKPHNKIPYELIHGRTPLIDFMKPFGCLVTILNTRDNLGKFDGKADEGFFVGYSVISKAMRVFNIRTRIVEETLNIRFLENAPNVKGNGPDWLFDVDSLTISMNYVPVIAGNQTNGIAGKRDNIVAGQAEKKIEPEQEYILIPFCTTDPLISQGPKDSEKDVGMKPTEVNESGASDKGEEDEQDTRSEFERLLQQEKQTNSTNSFNTVGTPVSAAGPTFTNDDPSSPVNAAEASNAFEDHLFE
ncbi:ribonuclease H-like domain-containing protein [Tanacetum coccineum]